MAGGSFIFVAQIEAERQLYITEIARLNHHITDQSESYSAEYSRLNENIVRLNEHICEQSASYTAEYDRLNKHIVEQNEQFGKLIKDHAQEIEKLTRRIEALTEASVFRKWAIKLASRNGLGRILGRALVVVLPRGLGERLKANVAAIIDGR